MNTKKTFVALLSLFIISGSLWKCSKSTSHRTVEIKPTYVTSSGCIECHTEAYDAWKGSHHDLAMQVANDSTVLGNFDNQTFEDLGQKGFFFRKDGDFYVRTMGDDGLEHDFKIEYTFGVHPLQQ